MCEAPCFLFLRMLHIKLRGILPRLFVHASCSTLNETFDMLTKVFHILLVRENPA